MQITEPQQQNSLAADKLAGLVFSISSEATDEASCRVHSPFVAAFLFSSLLSFLDSFAAQLMIDQ